MVQKLKAVSGFEEEMNVVCNLGRTNYGSVLNVRPPIINHLHRFCFTKTYSWIHSSFLVSDICQKCQMV